MHDRITIRIPNNNIPERKYAIHVLFEELLGLKLRVIAADLPDYVISAGGSGRIVIQDAFFGRYRKDQSYLCREALPGSVIFASNDFMSEKDIPVIYGNDEITVKGKSIHCGIDVVASAFFMLARWEEHISEELDEHGRFPTATGIAHQYGFVQRPVVNEYAEMLWIMLVSIGFKGQRKPHAYELVLTHDVDRLYCRPIFTLIRDLLKYRQIKRFIAGLYYYLMRIDPRTSFERIMTMSEGVNIRSRFYFIGGGSQEFENYYTLDDGTIKKTIAKITRRGHIIGFHPSYGTLKDEGMWRKEHERVEKAAGVKVIEGRQHYLRFVNPSTWRTWNDNGMQIDSTMGFADYIGFRCGTGNVFPVFDIVDRKMLALKERPLIIMDSAIVKMGKSAATMGMIVHLKELSKKYKMPFTVLFHNHTLDRVIWNRLSGVYDLILDDGKQVVP